MKTSEKIKIINKLNVFDLQLERAKDIVKNVEGVNAECVRSCINKLQETMLNLSNELEGE